MGRNFGEKAALTRGEIRHAKYKPTDVHGRVRLFNMNGLMVILVLAMKSVSAFSTGKTMSYPPLSTYEQELLTTALTEFAGNEEAFTAATHWSKEKLRFSKEGSGPFLGCAEYGQGQQALSDIQHIFGAGSARAVSQSPENGSCFIVTASHSDADAVLQDPSLAGLVSFGPFPCAMKIAPGLLEFSDLDDSKRLTTTHGRSIRMDNVKGLNLELSPGTLPAHDLEATALMQRLFEHLLSAELDLQATSFWSDSSPIEEGSARSHPEGTLRVREWRRAAQVVHELGVAAETSPGDICSWEEISFHHADDDILLVSGVDHLLYKGRGVGGVGDEATESKVACFMSLLSTLAAVPEVLRISPRQQKVLHNAAAFSTIQSATTSETPLTDLGLDGTGEIIQVLDTGLDYSSCFFIDEDGEEVEHGYYYEEVGFPTYSGWYDTSSKAAVIFNGGNFHADLSRRKLVQYINLVRSDTEGGDQYGDSFVTSGGNRYSWIPGDDFEYDYEAGHGTHVAGSALGSTIFSDPEMVNCSGIKEMGCVGGCIDPDASTDDFASYSAQWSLPYDLDRLCPRLDCDGLGASSDICLDDDEVTNVVEHGGMARAAQLAVFDIFFGFTTFGPSMMGNGLWAPAAEIGAKIHTNSWGAFLECQPDAMDIMYDDYMYQNPENLLLFSAGNEGDYYTDSSCTIGSPGLAKNVLTVGASCSGESRVSATGEDGEEHDGDSGFGDIDTIAYFSSYGPTLDERIKPEVVAPGDQVYSATSDASEDEYSCRLWMYAGTSMSCPIVAGAAALVRQYFKDPDFYAKDLDERGFCSGTPSWSSICSEFSPSAATVKALLINSANLMGGSTEPDGHRGFGRIQLDAGLPVNGEGSLALFVADAAVTSIASLTRDEYVFYVDGSAGLDLRATLSWVDPPTSPYSAKQLLHDLDLSLKAPSGLRYTMWRTNEVDSTNVNERVIVPATLMEGETGVWKAWVWAKSLTTSTQSYSLVVTGAISPSLAVDETTSPSTP